MVIKMKIFSQVLLFLLIISSSTFSQSYKLIWSDEFNGASLDQSVWTFETGNNNGWGNSELEYYTNRTENCTIQNGILTVTAAKESYSGYNYTSARIKTQGKFSVKYGKIEARIKLPYGQGIWPAFWMLGDNINQVSWPSCGEIDIMELIGGQGRDNTIHGSAHWGGDYTNSYSLSSGIFADDFHVFDITWNQKTIVWHVDGISYSTLDITPAALAAFQKSFFIIFNLAVGGNWPGNPDNTTLFPQTMQVDYVRVYQDTASLPVVSIVSPPDNTAFPPNSNITLIANASIANGNITKVDFFQDALKIGETFVSPYQMTWNNVLAGNYRIMATAFANTGNNSTSSIININVGGSVLTSPYGGTPARVPGTIEAENFDLGGQNNAYYDSDTQNNGGQYRPAEGVDIEACTDIGGGYDIGWTVNNEWSLYTISVKDSGTYQIGARVSSNSTNGSMHFEIDGNDVTGLMSVLNTGGWQTWASVLSKNFTLTSGIHQFKFFVNSAGFNINKFDIYSPLTKPTINFNYPAGGEQFSPDSIVEVKWNSLQIGTVNIGFSTNGGTFWSSVQNGADAEFGVYRWKVPHIISVSCKLIIMDPDNTSLFDTTKAFSIGVINSIDKNTETPKTFSLSQNYPNPFNPSTLIHYQVPGSALVNIRVYNLLGKAITTLVNETKTPGKYNAIWNGKDIYGNDAPSGIYFYAIHAGNFAQVKKMVLLR
jgi:beta-glucanase (GH16 family)